MVRAALLVLLLALTGALMACGGEDDPGTAGGGSSAAEAPAYETTTPEAIAEPVAEGDVLLVDVREDDEWNAGHAPDAIHVPLAEVGDRLDEIAEQASGRPVAFICRTGRRSAEASRTAVEGGLDDVINVEGGMEAWANAGLPLRPRDGEVI